MKDTLITYELAKLAKEKGFKWKTLYFYIINHNAGLDYILIDNLKQNQFDRISKEECHFGYPFRLAAPPQSLLQKWLREVHNIHIELQFDTISYGYRIFDPFKSNDYFTEWKYDKWTYELALEAGLKQALLLIK